MQRCGDLRDRSSKSVPGRIDYLGLRGVAIISMLLYLAYARRLGVELFFIISGFVVLTLGACVIARHLELAVRDAIRRIVGARSGDWTAAFARTDVPS